MPELQGQTAGVGPAPIAQNVPPKPGSFTDLYLAAIPDAPASPAPTFRAQINTNKGLHDLNLRRVAYALTRLVESWPGNFAITNPNIVVGGLHYVTVISFEGFVGSYVTIDNLNVSLYDNETNRLYARQDGVVTVQNTGSPGAPDPSDGHGESMQIATVTTDIAGNPTITSLVVRNVQQAWSQIVQFSADPPAASVGVLDSYFNTTDKRLHVNIGGTWYTSLPYGVEGFLSASPTWQKFTLTFADLAAAAANANANVFMLPSGGIVHAVKIKHSQAFTGGALTAYTVSVGTAGTPAKYAPAFDVFQAPGGTVYQLSNIMGAEDMANPVQLIARASAAGGNTNLATQGIVDVWLLLSLAG